MQGFLAPDVRWTTCLVSIAGNVASKLIIDGLCLVIVSRLRVFRLLILYDGYFVASERDSLHHLPGAPAPGGLRRPTSAKPVRAPNTVVAKRTFNPVSQNGADGKHVLPMTDIKGAKEGNKSSAVDTKGVRGVTGNPLTKAASAQQSARRTEGKMEVKTEVSPRPSLPGNQG